MHNFETPGNSKEHEADVAEKNRQIAEAAAAGDYEQVRELAQEAESMVEAKGEASGEAPANALEDNAQFDEAQAAQAKAERQAMLAEQVQADAEESQQAAAELLARLQGKFAESDQAESEEASEAKNAEAQAQELYDSLPEGMKAPYFGLVPDRLFEKKEDAGPDPLPYVVVRFENGGEISLHLSHPNKAGVSYEDQAKKLIEAGKNARNIGSVGLYWGQ